MNREREGKEMEVTLAVWEVLKQWRTILLLCLVVGMLVYMGTVRQYHPLYQTEATLFVTTRGNYNTIYNNQVSAMEAAAKFSRILSSRLLQRKVAEQLKQSRFEGTATAKEIPNTNLIQLSVISGTPEGSFRQMKSILEQYGDISGKLMGDAILEILQAPQVPVDPVEKLEGRTMACKAMAAVGIILCLMLGVVSALRDTVRTEADIQKKLDTKRLATIRQERKYKTFKARLRGGKESILMTDPTTSFLYVETMKKLSQRVKREMQKRQACILLITSVLENEGKSTVAANLALALSQESKRVLLVDCDFEKPSLYKVLHMQQQAFDDLGAVMNGKTKTDQLLLRVPETELYAILNTIAYSHSMELANSEILKHILSFFKSEMDYIILDTAPMSQVADAEEILQLTDAALLVVRQDKAEVRDINDAIDILNQEQEKMLGCVLNGVHFGYTMQSASSYYKYGGYYE